MTKAGDALGEANEKEQITRSTTRVMGSREDVDQEARDDATRVGARMDSHEVLCTERWNAQRQAVIELKTAFEDLRKKLDTSLGRVPVAIIATLTGLCGWLADRAFPFH